MKIYHLLYYPVLVIAVIIAGCSTGGPLRSETLFSPPGTVTTFILLRHAERDDSGHHSALTPKGQQRAKDLVRAIGDKGITAIYAPNRGRNHETAQPLVDHLGLQIRLIEEKQLINTRKFADTFVRHVLSQHPGEVVVWIGNKSPVGIWAGNLKEIYQRLGAEGNGPTRYSDLYFISVPDQGPVQVHKTSYGVLTGRFDQ